MDMQDGIRVAFTTHEAQRLTGLTPRRLQYWDQTDFIRPSVAARQGRGSPRLYSFRDIVQLKVAAQLRNDLSLQALRRLKEQLDVEAPFATVRFAKLADSSEVVYVGPGGHHEAARWPGQIVITFDVNLQEIRADLEVRIRAMRERRGAGRIGRQRGVGSGQPMMAGTRISPAAIKRMLAAGWDEAEILREYPELQASDIRAAIRYRAPARRAG